MKTTPMTPLVAAPSFVLGADVLGMPAVRERCIAPDAASTHGTGLSVADFGTALPGPPRGAPV